MKLKPNSRTARSRRSLHGVLCCITVILCGCEAEIRMESRPSKSAEYQRGVNDALDCITLLGLEQQLYETNRTWGSMTEIVAKRLNVDRAKR